MSIFLLFFHIGIIAHKRGFGINMTMSKCPKCKIVLVDPQLYFRGSRQKKNGLKMKIKCPSCDYKGTLEEFCDGKKLKQENNL